MRYCIKLKIEFRNIINSMLFHNFSGLEKFISNLCVIFPSLLESNTYYVHHWPVAKWCFQFGNEEAIKWMTPTSLDHNQIYGRWGKKSLSAWVIFRPERIGTYCSVSCFQFSYTSMNIMINEMFLLYHGLTIQIAKREYVYCS